jgi:hypothetical protein
MLHDPSAVLALLYASPDAAVVLRSGRLVVAVPEPGERVVLTREGLLHGGWGALWELVA